MVCIAQGYMWLKHMQRYVPGVDLDTVKDDQGLSMPMMPSPTSPSFWMPFSAIAGETDCKQSISAKVSLSDHRW